MNFELIWLVLIVFLFQYSFTYYWIKYKRWPKINFVNEFDRNRTSNIPHITGGVETSENEFPHMVALGYGDIHSPLFLCGGILITNQYVLTAAHCTSTRDAGPVRFVLLGSQTLTSPSNSSVTIPVSAIIDHPDYRAPSSYNDISLLRLEHKIPFSENISPARLFTSSKLKKELALLALGWGKTEFIGPSSNNLRKVQLKLVDYNRCNNGYKGVEAKLPRGVNNSIQICAGGEIGSDTCQGDSGGPLEYKSGSVHYIVGITSFGKPCGLTRIPGIYTRVATYIPWIESIIKSKIY